MTERPKMQNPIKEEDPMNPIVPFGDLNGLALEYQRDYGTAFRDLDISDIVNNPAASGKCSVLSLSFEEKTVNFLFR